MKRKPIEDNTDRTSMPQPTGPIFDGSTAGAVAAKIVPMRRSAFIVVAAGAMLVAALAVGLGSGRLPLGVPGEWEWPRVRRGPSLLPLGFAIASIAAYSAFVAIGLRSLGGRTTRRREAGWLAGLVVAAVGLQGTVQEGAPEGYGLSKWIFALHAPGSSGYFTVAKAQMADPARFL